MFRLFLIKKRLLTFKKISTFLFMKNTNISSRVVAWTGTTTPAPKFLPVGKFSSRHNYAPVRKLCEVVFQLAIEICSQNKSFSLMIL